MTTLDRAFIRAFHLETARPSSSSETRPAERESPVEHESADLATPDDDWDGLEATPASGPSAATAEQPTAAVSLTSLVSPLDSSELEDSDGDRKGSIQTSQEADELLQPAESDTRETPSEPNVDVEEPCSEPMPTQPCEAVREVGLVPTYQVDSFAWPAECTKLGLKAAGQLARLIEGLEAGCLGGHKVIAMTACSRGEGCTTLLLCAARRLARGERKVVVVDADFDNPQIAPRLGMLPETGWEEVVAGRLPLGEAMVESARDRLAVVPLLNQTPRVSQSTLSYSDLAASLALLREYYDMVLVDFGQFPQGTVTEAAGHWIDAAVLIHDIRRTSHAELARVRKRIEAAGVVEIGVVENFV